MSAPAHDGYAHRWSMVHDPTYRQGVRINEQCEPARRIIEAARQGRTLAGSSPTTPRRPNDDA